jgi:SAM-dependent methyltransferase
VSLPEIAPGLILDKAGYWLTSEEAEVSYPTFGHNFCMGIEDESFWFRHRNRAITAAVRLLPPAAGPIFDVGAGNGYVAAALEAAGFPTIAIEPGRDGAENAVRRGIRQVVCGSLPSCAFLPNQAGAIGLFDVIEHIEADREFLQSLRQYLRDGGRLYITAPAHRWLWSGNDVRAGHVRRYTLAALRRVLLEAGYRTEYATYIFWSAPLPILLFRTLRSTRDDSGRRSQAHHRAGGAVFRRVAEASLAFESRRIARGASIPFGSSCLVVATIERSGSTSRAP